MTFDWTIKISDLATIIALLAGPIVAVLLTFHIQRGDQKRTAKMGVFLTLLGERKKVVTPAGANALNTIDVVFSDAPDVLILWHRYYELLHGQPGEARSHTWIELLQAMAVHLGYPKLTLITLDKFYTPQGHVDQQDLQSKISQNFLRVLEHSDHLGSPRKGA